MSHLWEITFSSGLSSALWLDVGPGGTSSCQHQDLWCLRNDLGNHGNKSQEFTSKLELPVTSFPKACVKLTITSTERRARATHTSWSTSLDVLAPSVRFLGSHHLFLLLLCLLLWKTCWQPSIRYFNQHWTEICISNHTPLANVWESPPHCTLHTQKFKNQSLLELKLQKKCRIQKQTFWSPEKGLISLCMTRDVSEELQKHSLNQELFPIQAYGEHSQNYRSVWRRLTFLVNDHLHNRPAFSSTCAKRAISPVFSCITAFFCLRE